MTWQYIAQLASERWRPKHRLGAWSPRSTSTHVHKFGHRRECIGHARQRVPEQVQPPAGSREPQQQQPHTGSVLGPWRLHSLHSHSHPSRQRHKASQPLSLLCSQTRHTTHDTRHTPHATTYRMETHVSDVSADKAAGRVPLRRLPRTSRYLKLCMTDASEGMGPVSS